jgi:anaerobic selenocysteine-containing dehydrogenase
MGLTARDQTIELPIAWTDWWGKEHKSVTGNPVAFHAMRGLAAHSNGFQTIRALAILMSAAGHHRPPRSGFRHKRAVPARRAAQCTSAKVRRTSIKPNTPLDAPPLGWPETPAKTCASTTQASRCASTRASPGSTRCRCTG